MTHLESVFANSQATGAGSRAGAAWLFTRLALQNVLRRPVRTSMLILSVALGTAAVFASFIVGRGMDTSMQRSFSRMGADLIVVPKEAMVNITSALLTVQPTEATIDRKLLAEVGRLDGVEHVTGQTIYRVPIMAGMPNCKANLIAFDPAGDFTIMSWLENCSGPMKTGELIAGCRRQENVGEEVQPCNVPANIYGRLGRSGVGPLDESFFASYDTVEALARAPGAAGLFTPAFDRSRVSAILVRLSFGSTVEPVRFAIARLPGIKVVSGARVVTATRQTTKALLGGMLAFTALMLLASLMLVSLLFSAIITERQREIGLLRAVGARRGDIIGMLLSEAAVTTSLGGFTGLLLGGALLLAFQRSLVYFLQTLHVEFSWPLPIEITFTAAACLTAATAVGLLGAALPAWRASAREAYTLIQGGNS